MCGAMSDEWNPGDLTGLAATIVVSEQRAGGKLWQNTAKTTPATADGDPVRVAVCPYTAVEWTAVSDAARPLLWDEGGGKWSLSFDGVDDYLVATIPALTNCTLAGRIVAVTNGNASGRIVMFASSPDTFEIAACLIQFVGTCDSNRRDGSFRTATYTGAIPSYPATVTLLGNDKTITRRDNGVQVGTGTNGSIAMTGITTRVSAGASPFGGSNYAATRIAGLVLCSTALTGDDLTDMETFLGAI